ncbi:hypothetical protein NC651_017361 [Populus alba x Populus x berolinensis]|nr:hypothetical protein NC651_017361 [Populus alba x Populus x berolinensis]
MRRFWRERNGRLAQLTGEGGEKSEIRVSLWIGSNWKRRRTVKRERRQCSFVGNSEEIPIDDVDEIEELEEAHNGMLEMSVQLLFFTDEASKERDSIFYLMVMENAYELWPPIACKHKFWPQRVGMSAITGNNGQLLSRNEKTAPSGVMLCPASPMLVYNCLWTTIRFCNFGRLLLKVGDYHEVRQQEDSGQSTSKYGVEGFYSCVIG